MLIKVMAWACLSVAKKNLRHLPFQKRLLKPFNLLLSPVRMAFFTLMLRHLRLSLSLLGLTGFHFFISGQPHESLTIENGLSQGFVSSIIQDHMGFMWIATIDGLNRYDGVSFKVFRHNAADSFSLPADRVRYVFEDSNDLIWTITEGGISCYESQNERYYSFDFYKKLSQVERLDLSRMMELKYGEYCIFSSDTVYFIEIEHKNQIKPENINRFQFKKYGFSSSTGEIRSVLNTGDTIWVCTERGIWCDYGRRDDFKLALKHQNGWNFNGLWVHPKGGKLLAMAHDRLFCLTGE